MQNPASEEMSMPGIYTRFELYAKLTQNQSLFALAPIVDDNLLTAAVIAAISILSFFLVFAS